MDILIFIVTVKLNMYSGFSRPEFKIDAKYMGGHPRYQKQKDTKVLIYGGGIEIEKFHLRIPFSSMESVNNKDEREMDSWDKHLLPYWEAMKHAEDYTYTRISFVDESTQLYYVILRFKKNSSQAAPYIIYERKEKASQARKSQSLNRFQNHNLKPKNVVRTNIQTNKGKICKVCNSENSVNSRFCNICGTAF